MSAEFYRDIIANAFNQNGWEYSVEKNQYIEEQYEFDLYLSTGMTGGNIRCRVSAGVLGDCSIMVDFLDAICPEDRIKDMCYLIAQLNEYGGESSIWRLSVKKGEIYKIRHFSFPLDSQLSHEDLFEIEFNNATDYRKEDLEAILNICNGIETSNSERGNEGIKIKF